MRNSIIKAATAMSFIAFFSLSGESGFVQTAHAQWWKCPSGQYTLETIPNQNKARCVKAGGRTRVQPDAGCPVGTTHQRDARGNTDLCAYPTGTVGPRPIASQCGRGQQVERRRGTDRCYRNSPADYKPVSTRG